MAFILISPGKIIVQQPHTSSIITIVHKPYSSPVLQAIIQLKNLNHLFNSFGKDVEGTGHGGSGLYLHSCLKIIMAD